MDAMRERDGIESAPVDDIDEEIRGLDDPAHQGDDEVDPFAHHEQAHEECVLPDADCVHVVPEIHNSEEKHTWLQEVVDHEAN